MKYLLDTNVLSEPLKPQPSASVMQLIAVHEAEICTAAVVWHELWFGCARLLPSTRQNDIRIYLRALEDAGLVILPYTASAAVWHGQERARLQRAGLTPGFADGQIAAIAQEHELIIVTRNSADFRVFEGVRLENWF